jgi:hypothetical protein
MLYISCTGSLPTYERSEVYLPSEHLESGTVDFTARKEKEFLTMLDQGRAYIAEPHVRTMMADDGCILLNVDSGRFYSSTGLGAQIWSQLIHKNEPATVRQLASGICADASSFSEPMLRDINLFLENLKGAGFISSVDEASLELQAPQRVDVLRGSANAARIPTIVGFCMGIFLRTSRVSRILTAYLAIAAADLIIKLGGFRALYRAVRNWPVSSRKATDRLPPEEILCAVDKASAFYRRKARCLQRSCSAVWLLRTVGVPAQLIIGCRKIPFLAHAWVEIDNQVVGDSPLIKNLCTPLDCI